jgi:TetR/AcrR family transcriptional repressor of mexJK operon
MTPRPDVKEERRGQILEAALKSFVRSGFHKTTMDEIAAELPFSKGLLYYYFNNKRDLFLALLDNWVNTSISTWESLQTPGEDATTQICHSLEFGVQLIRSSMDLTRVELEFYSELVRTPEVSEAFKQVFRVFRASLLEILEKGIQTQEFEPHNADALAAVLVGAYEGLAIQATVEPDIFDWDAITESMCAFVIHGISASSKE